MKKKQTRHALFAHEGADAFTAALTTNDCPYQDAERREWWLHGWWGAYYKERDRRIDAGELCSHCAGPMDSVTTGVYIIGRHGTTKTVCGDCKTDLVQWSDYQVMGQAR